MKKVVFYLKTCITNKKIMSPMDLSDWELREIKSKPVTEEELAEMYALSGSYESLFNRRSTQIKVRNINVKVLQESDFKTLLLEHYSFLKRPVFIMGEYIFIGNDQSNIERLYQTTNTKISD